MTAITAMTAATVYSRTRRVLQEPPDRLEGQETTDRDGDEEDQLLDRDVGGQRPADEVPVVESPVVAGDGHDVPDQEERDGRDERHEQTTRTPPDTRADHELERQRDDQAGGHQRQVLELVHGLQIVPGIARRPRAGHRAGAPVGSPAMASATP